MNPLYNGWIRRHRGEGESRARRRGGRTRPCQTSCGRASRTSGGKDAWRGTAPPGRLDSLRGLLECVCGRRIRSDGRMGNSDRIAKLHTDPVRRLGPKAASPHATWEVPILAQLGGTRARRRHLRAQIVAGLSARAHRPVTMDRARLERQMRELALEHAAARLDDAVYLARMARLRGALENRRGAAGAGDLPARRAIEWLDALAETWQQTELIEEKADVIHAIYERIVVEGPRVRRPSASHRRRTGTDWRSHCQRLLWRARQDSNLRPLGPEPNALSTELQARDGRGARGARVTGRE